MYCLKNDPCKLYLNNRLAGFLVHYLGLVIIRLILCQLRSLERACFITSCAIDFPYRKVVTGLKFFLMMFSCRSATYFRQLAKRKETDSEEHAPTEPEELSRPSSNDTLRKEDENSVGLSRKEKFELSSIVKSIKLKSQQLPKPSSVQVKNDKMDHGSSRKEKKHKLDGLDRKSKKAKV